MPLLHVDHVSSVITTYATLEKRSVKNDYKDSTVYTEPMVFRLAALCIAITSAFAGVDPRSVTIDRDTWGVPHIYAKTDAGAAYGLMYAQAEDNFWQLETDYIRIVGRAAEVEGPPEITGDIMYRAYEVEKRAKEAYAHADPKLRNLCDAF